MLNATSVKEQTGSSPPKVSINLEHDALHRLNVEVSQQRKLQGFLRELAGKLHGSKAEDSFWFGRKIQDCTDQYDAALKASLDVLVRNPATSVEQLVCSVEALDQRLCIMRRVVSQIAVSLPIDDPFHVIAQHQAVSSTIRK